MKKIYKKYGVKETKFNDSKIRRLYHLYLHQTIFDQILDVLVFFAISFTIFEVIAELFFTLSENFLHIIHSFSVLVLTILGLELLREYAVAEHRKEFFRKNWMDFVLVIFLSVYLFSAAYFGLARFEKLVKLEKYVKETKHFKIVLKTLGFNIGEF